MRQRQAMLAAVHAAAMSDCSPPYPGQTVLGETRLLVIHLSEYIDRVGTTAAS